MHLGEAFVMGVLRFAVSPSHTQPIPTFVVHFFHFPLDIQNNWLRIQFIYFFFFCNIYFWGRYFAVFRNQLIKLRSWCFFKAPPLDPLWCPFWMPHKWMILEPMFLILCSLLNICAPITWTSEKKNECKRHWCISEWDGVVTNCGLSNQFKCLL